MLIPASSEMSNDPVGTVSTAVPPPLATSSAKPPVIVEPLCLMKRSALWLDGPPMNCFFSWIVPVFRWFLTVHVVLPVYGRLSMKKEPAARFGVAVTPFVQLTPVIA